MLFIAAVTILLLLNVPISTAARDKGDAVRSFARQARHDQWEESATSLRENIAHHPGDTPATTCDDIDGHILGDKFTELSGKMYLMDSDGELCHVHDHHDHPHHEHSVEEESNDTDHNITVSSCDDIYGFIQELLVDLDLTEKCCLTDNYTCASNSSTTNIAKAYGYGFLMVTAVSLLSLLGLILLPFIKGNNQLAAIYEYISTFLIALGTSAVFSGAILHLLPRVLDLDDNKDGYLVKGVVISIGLYVLYLFEVTLHSCNAHYHHGQHGEPTMPHGPCRDTFSGHTCNTAIESSSSSKVEKSSPEKYDETAKLITKNSKQGCFGRLQGVRPLAWIIIFGDSIHNFADGLTLGAAIAQSLSLGLSTTIAIILHEIPHELGDYAILLSTGLSWYAALLLNFFSSLTAIIGFFVGVTIGTESEESNRWILTLAVGLFLYVALVDLLPELIHSNQQKGYKRIIHIMLANIGFFISFAVLFLIAIYEKSLDRLFD